VKLLVDMSLTPEWVSFLSGNGIEAEHWSEVGNPKAPDHEIMAFARERGYVVFTHDLDFGHLLAATNARGPSVIQVRTQNPTSAAVAGAIVTATNIDTAQSRSVQTSALGEYSLPLLPIGEYTILISAPGFANSPQASVTMGSTVADFCV